MATHLDNGFIRRSSPSALAAYFMEALKTTGTNEISSHLLSAVATEALPPTVFAVWLGVCHNPGALNDVLWQTHSAYIREQAIRRFGKLIRTNRCLEVCNCLGGTTGLLDFLAWASVLEVRFFCKIVGASGTSSKVRPERERLVTELLKGLAHEHFPESRYKTTDTRPLLRHYASLLPACTKEMALIWMDNKELPRPRVVSRSAYYWPCRKPMLNPWRTGC
jgi:hypothetical protein